jgi:hypothetical protein
VHHPGQRDCPNRRRLLGVTAELKTCVSQH